MTTTDMGAVAEACRSFLALYDDQSVEKPEPSAFGPNIIRLLWAIDRKPGDPYMACPEGCGWEVGPLTRLDGGEVRHVDNMLSNFMAMSEHLREDHGAMFPWEDEPGQDQRINLQLEPARVTRLLEVLQSAGAHPSGLGSYEAAADALAFAEDLGAMAERQGWTR